MKSNILAAVCLTINLISNNFIFYMLSIMLANNNNSYHLLGIYYDPGLAFMYQL